MIGRTRWFGKVGIFRQRYVKRHQIWPKPAYAQRDRVLAALKNELPPEAQGAWFGPATQPSSDIVMLSLSFVIGPGFPLRRRLFGCDHQLPYFDE
jgi:hypothetical protein